MNSLKKYIVCTVKSNKKLINITILKFICMEFFQYEINKNKSIRNQTIQNIEKYI